MKIAYRFVTAMLFISLIACHKADQPTPSDLAGTWSGTFETQQVGNCKLSGENPIQATAKWQISDSKITGEMVRIYSANRVPVQFTGSVNGSRVTIVEPTGAICFGEPYRSYDVRYEGTITGNNLTLMANDSTCPAQGCIFRRVFKLTKQ